MVSFLPLPRQEALDLALAVFKRRLAERDPQLAAKAGCDRWTVETSLREWGSRAVDYCPSGGGVYVYSDACSANDPYEYVPTGTERYTVIRYIGKAKQFIPRVSRRISKNERPHCWRWFEYISIPDSVRFLSRQLELFLLATFRTTDNRNDTKHSFGRYLNCPCVFDDNPDETFMNEFRKREFVGWLDGTAS